MNLSQTSTTRPEITTKDFGALKLKFSDAKTGCDDVTYQDKLDQTNDIEDFIQWSTSVDTSDVTIQNEEEIFCEIHGRMKRVTKRNICADSWHSKSKYFFGYAPSLIFLF